MGLTGGVWCVMHFTPGGIVSVSLFFYVKSLNLGQADDRDGRVQRHLPLVSGECGIDPDVRRRRLDLSPLHSFYLLPSSQPQSYI